MRFEELPPIWQKIFELAWQSLCKGSKAIAAVIVNEQGEIISEGRNRIGEACCPNPIVVHAETEVIRNLDISKYPDTKKYTLYAGLEPCPMCMGTIVMGRIRNVVIAARDDFGGAMKLIEHSSFMKSKNIQVTWLDNGLGDMQRAFQTVRELLFNEDKNKLESILQDFSVYNKAGVDVAKALVASGYFEGKNLEDISVEEVFNQLARRFQEGMIC
ncbi:MAG: nucleoside deaminase [Lachnospiraceae bacterium]|nr:nucleoside deaminase [Lachnospiraceae bacterium]